MPQKFRWYIEDSSESKVVDGVKEKLYTLRRESMYVPDATGQPAILSDKEIADYLFGNASLFVDSVTYGEDVWDCVSDYLGDDANYYPADETDDWETPVVKPTHIERRM